MSTVNRACALIVLCVQATLTSCAYLDLVREVRFPNARQMRVADSKFFLSNGGQITLLEMGDLRRPTPVVNGTVVLPTADIRNIVVNDKDIIISASDKALLLRGERDAVAVVSESSIESGEVTVAVTVQDKIFVFSNTEGKARVNIFQTSANGKQELRTTINLIGEVIDVVTQHNMVYAISSVGYILVFDSTKTDGYTLRSITPTLQKPTCLTMFFDFLYVGVADELRAYYVHPTGNLEEASKVSVDSMVRDVFFTRGNVYVATDAGLTIVDVKDPRHPFESGFRSISSPARSLDVFIDIAYIVTADGRLVMIDVVPPADEATLIATPTPTALKKKKVTIWDMSEDVKQTAIGTSGAPFELLEIDNGVSAWSDLAESQFFDFPEWLIDGKMYMSPSTFEKGTKLKIECADPVCNVFIFFEHCLPCSTPSNGGLPSILVTEGWVPSSCGPKFRVRRKGVEHKTVIFRKQLRKGTIETLPAFTKEAKFVGFAIIEGRNMCKDIGIPSECNTGTFLCGWDEVVGGCLPKVTSCKISKRKGISLPLPKPAVQPVVTEPVEQRRAVGLEQPPDSPPPAPSPVLGTPHEATVGSGCMCAAYE